MVQVSRGWLRSLQVARLSIQTRIFIHDVILRREPQL